VSEVVTLTLGEVDSLTEPLADTDAVAEPVDVALVLDELLEDDELDALADEVSVVESPRAPHKMPCADVNTPSTPPGVAIVSGPLYTTHESMLRPVTKPLCRKNGERLR
jgi:hypothetical protein